MKMKSNNLPAVLLAVIMAAAVIFTCGLFSQSYADSDYTVKIGTGNDWTFFTGLPGSTIELSATLYSDYDGEKVVESDGLDFRWELGAGDSQFAKLNVKNIDNSVAHVKFKDLPEDQTEIEAYITVKVSVYADGRKVATDSVELTESTDFYYLNTYLNEYLKPGDTQEVVASVSHYNMEHPDGEFVKNVQFEWKQEGGKLDIVKNEEKSTEEESFYDITRRSYEETLLVLEAKWGEGEEAREEYSVLWTWDVPTDMDEFEINFPTDFNQWAVYVDSDDEVLPIDDILRDTNVFYGNLHLQEGTDFDFVIYKYNGYDEETGDVDWVEYTGDLKVDPKGSAPDKNNEPTEGSAVYKVAARAKGDILTGETDEYAQYIFMYSKYSLSGVNPSVSFNRAYVEFLDDEPYMRVEVKPGVELEPEVTVNEEIINPVNYKCVYEGENNDYIGEEFPTEPGLYTMHIEGVEPYYGTSYSQYIKVGMDNENFKASGKTVKVKVGKKKKTTKKKTFAKSKAFKVSGNEGTVTFKKSSGNKKITVASNGKVTVKKGLKKGTYKVKVKVTDNESDEYFAVTKTVTLKVKVTK